MQPPAGCGLSCPPQGFIDETRSLADRGGVGVVGARSAKRPRRSSTASRSMATRSTPPAACSSTTAGSASSPTSTTTRCATTGGRLSDRGPGGGTLDYEVRVHRFTLDVNKHTGAISNFQVRTTFIFRKGAQAFNGLAPGDRRPARRRVRSRRHRRASAASGTLIVSDEYGPSVYEFTRVGPVLARVPRAGRAAAAQCGTGIVNYATTPATRGQAHEPRLRRARDLAGRPVRLRDAAERDARRRRRQRHAESHREVQLADRPRGGAVRVPHGSGVARARHLGARSR